MTKDDIIICDPEAEYFPLVHRLGGQVIKISPTSSQYVNPMDMSLNYSEDDNPLALKSDFILSFCELAAGGRNGLEPVEKTVIDRAVRVVYRPYLADPKPENVPVLGDLYDEIKRQPEPEAQRIAAALELYVHGSLNVLTTEPMWISTTALSALISRNLASSSKSWDAGHSGSGMEPRHGESERGQVHAVLCGRVPSSAARRGWFLECGDLETLS